MTMEQNSTVDLRPIDQLESCMCALYHHLAGFYPWSGSQPEQNSTLHRRLQEPLMSSQVGTQGIWGAVCVKIKAE